MMAHDVMFPSLDKTRLSWKDIENDLKKCDSIKYAAYRTAAKLRALQKAFYLDKIQLKVISNVFERHQLQQTENSVQLDQKEVEAVISDIFFALKKINNVLLDVDYFSQLMSIFFFEVFNKKTSKTVQVLSFKVGLTLLCEAKPREKYHYLFEQLADHNNCLSRKKLEILLKKMISLTEHLGEGLSFGSNLIPGTVESCFQCNIGSLGLSEDAFMAWLMQDPQLLVWLSTLYRMQISESVSHNAKCEICKIFPLKGLRYRCLRCLAYDMCQSCFFTGKLNKKHKLKHPVQEYCCPMTSQQSTKAFLLTLRNRLCRKDSKLQYLPALRVDSHEAKFMSESTRLLDEMEISSRTVVNGSRISLERFPYKELQSVILQLERESEEMIPEAEEFWSGVGNCEAQLKNRLLKHRARVRAQVQRLKYLRSYLAPGGRPTGKGFVASTPAVGKFSSKNSRVDSVDFSPISVRPSGRGGETNRERMAWDGYEPGSCCGPVREAAETEGWETPRRPAEITGTEQVPQGEVEFQLSTLLGGKTLRELEGSEVMRGMTWLKESECGTSEEDKVRRENEETLEELQGDLRRILGKLQELSMATSRGEALAGETDTPGNYDKAEDLAGEVDSMLLDLINGIEKLMGS